MANSGKIAQIIGPVVDVSFAGNDVTLPKILNALIVKKEDGNRNRLLMSTTFGTRHYQRPSQWMLLKGLQEVWK